MLVGQYETKISKKGRIAFPKKFRGVLGNRIFITRGWEGCLIAVSEKEWQVLLEGTEDKPFAFGPKRDTNRFLLGNAIMVEPDEQGRFVLPKHLRDYGEFGEEEVIFLGLSKYVEVWAKQKWEKYQDYLAKNISEISGKLVNG